MKIVLSDQDGSWRRFAVAEERTEKSDFFKGDETVITLSDCQLKELARWAVWKVYGISIRSKEDGPC